MEMKTARLSPKEARWHLPDRETGLAARPASHPANQRELDGRERSALRGGARARFGRGEPRDTGPGRPVLCQLPAGQRRLRADTRGAEGSGGSPGRRPRCGDAEATAPGARSPPSPATPPARPGPAAFVLPERRGRRSPGLSAGPIRPRTGGTARGNGGPARPGPPAAQPAVPSRRFPAAAAEGSSRWPRAPPAPQSPGRRHLLPARRSSRGRRDEPAPRGPRVDSPGGCRRPRGGEIQRRERRESRAPRCCCVSAAASSAAGWGRGAAAAARPWPRGVAERAGGGRSGRRRGREGRRRGRGRDRRRDRGRRRRRRRELPASRERLRPPSCFLVRSQSPPAARRSPRRLGQSRPPLPAAGGQSPPRPPPPRAPRGAPPLPSRSPPGRRPPPAVRDNRENRDNPPPERRGSPRWPRFPRRTGA